MLRLTRLTLLLALTHVGESAFLFDAQRGFGRLQGGHTRGQ